MPRMNPITKKFVITNDTPKFAPLSAGQAKRKVVREIRVSLSDGDPGKVALVKVSNCDAMGSIDVYAAPGYTKWTGLDLLPASENTAGDLRVQVEGLGREDGGGQAATVEVDYLVEST